MSRLTFKKFLRWIKRYYRIVNVSIGALMLFAVFINGTLAWHNSNQRGFIPAHGAAHEELIMFPFVKLEIDTKEPIPDVRVALYRIVEEESARARTVQGREQVLISPADNPWSNGALFTTDSDGEIVFELPPGNYCIVEMRLPVGYVPLLDAEYEPIEEWCFELRLLVEVNGDGDDASQIITHEIYFEGELVEEIIAFSRRLPGDLEIEKIVENAAGDPLTNLLLEMEFEFVVHFSFEGEEHEGSYYYVVYDENDELYGDGFIESGGRLTLRHGQRAMIEDLPSNLEYRVEEIPPAGFRIVAPITTGTIIPRERLAGDEKNLVTFTNINEGFGTITVCKEVRGDGADYEREFRFDVTIGDDTEEIVLRHGECSPPFENILHGTPYFVREHDYTGEGIIPELSFRSGYMGRENLTFVFNNHFNVTPGIGLLEVEKQVIGVGSNLSQPFNFQVLLGDLPEEPFEVIINRGGTTEAHWITPNDEQQYTLTFDLTHNGHWSIDGLPYLVTYVVTEAATPGFVQETVSVGGRILPGRHAHHLFRNIIEDSRGSIRVCKELENEDANFPSDTDFNFVLQVGGERYEFSLRAGECRDFGNLPVGEIFNVREVNIPSRYELIPSEGRNDFGTITVEQIISTFVNRSVEIEIPVEKLWENRGTNAPLPEYIVVHLIEGNSVVEVIYLRPDEHGVWEDSFFAPRYDTRGDRIEYEIVEVPVPGWTQEVESNSDGTVTITNTKQTPVILDDLQVEKRIIGTGTMPTQAHVFEFYLTPIDDAPMPSRNTISIDALDVVSNDGYATTFGNIRFTTAGIFEYMIHEIDSGTPGYTYDEAIFRLVITVEEDGDELVIAERTIHRNRESEPVDEIVFTNIYEASEDYCPSGDIIIEVDENGIVNVVLPDGLGDKKYVESLNPNGSITVTFPEEDCAVNRNLDVRLAGEGWRYEVGVNADGHVMVTIIPPTPQTPDGSPSEGDSDRGESPGLSERESGRTPGESGPNQSSHPDTGDTTSITLWLILTAVSSAGMTFCLLHIFTKMKRRKRA